MDTLARYYLVAAVPLLVIVALLGGVLPVRPGNMPHGKEEAGMEGAGSREEGAA